MNNLENTPILDLTTENIAPLAPDEIFIQLDQQGFPDYFISNYSRLYSKHTRHCKLMTPQINSLGYARYGLMNEHGEYSHLLCHRLVAFAFIPNPDAKNKNYVHHIVEVDPKKKILHKPSCF